MSQPVATEPKPLQARSLECHFPITVEVTSLRGGEASAIATRLWIRESFRICEKGWWIEYHLKISVAHPPLDEFCKAGMEEDTIESDHSVEQDASTESQTPKEIPSTWLTTVFTGLLSKQHPREPYSAIASVGNDDLSVNLMDFGEDTDNHELAEAVSTLCRASE
jgi:hypothetical protein